MADIELVIKINESKLWLLKNEPIKENFNIYELASYIDKGVPLPKGHGDLKDESDLDLFAPNLGTDEYVDDLMAKHNIDYVNGDDEDKVRAFAMDLIHSCNNVIKTAPTIIEADEAGIEPQGSEEEE